MKIHRIWVLLILSLAAVGLPAETPWSAGRSRGEDLIVKLVTVEPGDPVYTWWGHTALVVEDRRLKISRFYNYGLFSFDAEHFYRNFAQGRLYFQVGVFDTRRELAFYKYLNRTIRMQTLDLSPGRKLEMARFLDWNVLPENRVYLYDHYDDNCATRVRDLIDRMVDGSLASVGTKPGRMTLRQHTRRHTHRSFGMDWLLMYLMGASIDQPLTAWEEMFLPTELQRNIDRVVITDKNGSRPLVSKVEVYYSAKDRTAVMETAARHWPWGLLLGLILAVPAACGAIWMRRGSTAGRLLYSLYGCVSGLVWGLFGTVLFLMSLFTDHTVTYGNINLFLTNPLTLAAVPLGIALALNRPWARRWLPRLWLILAVAALVSLLFKLLPGNAQQNWLTLSALLPPLICFGLSFFILGSGDKQS